MNDSMAALHHMVHSRILRGLCLHTHLEEEHIQQKVSFSLTESVIVMLSWHLTLVILETPHKAPIIICKQQNMYQK